MKEKMTFIEPIICNLKNQKMVIKNSQKANKKIYCFAVNWYKDIKSIMLYKLLELILKNIMEERNFTIGHKVITKENIYLIVTFENTQDVEYLAKNFIFSKEIFEEEKEELKRQFLEIKKIGFNKWRILDEVYKSFLYNMPIIDIGKIPSVLNIIDNMGYEDLRLYTKNILKSKCKIIEYVGK